MKKLWMRVGMSFSLSDAEIEAILGEGYHSEKMAEVIRLAFKEGRYELDGDTYVTEESVVDFNEEYETDYDLGEPECCL